MGLMGALLLTLSAATPASSVFVIVPEIIAQAGTGALWSLLIAATVALAMSLVYAELGSATPWTGGEYAIVAQRLGPLPGMMILGANLTSLILSTAVLALGVANYLGAVAPHLSRVAVAEAVIGGATLLGVLNIRTNARVTGGFLALELAALLIVAGLGVLHPSRPLAQVLLHPVALNGGGGLGPASLAGIGLAVTGAVFAFDGYGSAVYFGEEVREASRDVARAVRWALGLTVLTELVPVTALLCGAPDLRTLFASDNMLATFTAARAGAGLAAWLSVGVALAILNAVIVMILISARQLYSTGRDGVWWGGANRALARVHPRLGSPLAATLLAGGLSGAACLVDERLLVTATGAGLVAIYAALCLCVVFGRAPAAEVGAYTMPGRPWPAVFALLVLAGVVAANLMDAKAGRISLGFTAAVTALSAAYYAGVLRRRGAWRLQGPSA